jgi:hypothetical protein
MTGDRAGALAAYQAAAAGTLNVPERRYLQLKAAALRHLGDPAATGTPRTREASLSQDAAVSYE